MFYAGDLQSGIALAIKNHKSVVCFITNEGPQSQVWQSEYLVQDDVAAALSRQAVTLRILAESQEVTYLKAYYPVHTVPSLIIIHNGNLRLELQAGTSKAEFVEGIVKVLADSASEASGVTLGIADEPTRSNHVASVRQNSTGSFAPLASRESQHNVETAQHVTSPPPTDSTTDSTTDRLDNAQTASPTIERLLADRRQKLERQRKEQEAKDRAARKAQAESRQAALSADPTAEKGQRASWALEQKRRKQEAQTDRERVLTRIEEDKADRRAREERKKLAAHVNGAAATLNQNETAQSTTPKTSTPQSGDCALQVRLLDGSTIRTRLPASTTIASHVRPWIDAASPRIKEAYVLKQILTPMPNRSIEAQHETQPLSALGLTPSSTLVLLPVRGGATAYASNQNPVTKAMTSVYGILIAMLGGLWSILATFVRTVQPVSNQHGVEGKVNSATGSTAQTDGASGQGSKIRIRTLQDQREDQRREGSEQQFYNGNQLNFEPRKRDGDDTDDKT